MKNATRFRTYAIVVAWSVYGLLGSGATAAQEADGDVYTGCLGPGGNVVHVAIGSEPARACARPFTQISWNEAGPEGPPGPAAPQSWVQLLDRNFTNELTALGNLNLSNEGINPWYTTGGYMLTTVNTTNDTLEFPEPGHYLVHVQLTASFLWPLTPQTFGDTYQVLFNISDGGSNVGSMVFDGMIPNETAQDSNVAQVTLSRSLIVYNPTAAPELSIDLSNFNFDLAFGNKLSVGDISVQVQKLEQ